jgi:hypothetical protein
MYMYMYIYMCVCMFVCVCVCVCVCLYVAFFPQAKRFSFTSGEKNDLCWQEICNCSRNELDVIYIGVSKNVPMRSWEKL